MRHTYMITHFADLWPLHTNITAIPVCLEMLT